MRPLACTARTRHAPLPACHTPSSVPAALRPPALPALVPCCDSTAGVGAQGGTQRGDERLPVALVFWYMPDSGDSKVVEEPPLACARSH